MKQYMTIAPDGRVDSLYDLADDEAPPNVDGFAVEEVAVPFNGWPAGPTPTSALHWHEGAFSWLETADVAGAQAIAWERVKAARDKAEAGTFEFEGGIYDLNKENVSGAALAALMAQLAGQPFSIEWTLADNSVRVLDATTMQALGRSMVAHIDALHCTARGLRERISAATTPDEAYAVTWPTE